MKTAVIAIGGNAILRSEEDGTIENQKKNVDNTAEHLVDLIEEGFEIVVTHGNGPQVGAILIQNDAADDEVPAMPLDVCVAESQGQLGYLLQHSFNECLRKRKMKHVSIALITQVLVNLDDPAFANPTKYVGPYYTLRETAALEKKGWIMKEDPRGGYRRVVASPAPVDIIEKEAIKRLVFGDDKYVVIALGGGGIPVVEKNGALMGVEAVIDKDLASSVLASSIGERFFIILTDVPHILRNFGTTEEEPIDSMTLEEAKELFDAGEFPPGSMGPKIQAAINFLKGGGEEVLITSTENLVKAMRGEGGTWIRQTRKNV